MSKEIKFEVVAVEREDAVKRVVYGSSGLLIDNRFVITTGNILFSLFDHHFISILHSRKTGTLHTDIRLPQKLNLKIFRNHENNLSKYFIENGDLLGMFISHNVKLTSSQTLDGWALDVAENSRELSKLLSMFFVFKIEKHKKGDDFNSCLSRWWQLIRNLEISQCNEILIRSVPFGNKTLLDSYSTGIVANIIGYSSCLIVSDCPSTPGSEGSPVYKLHNTGAPFGIVLASSCWWRRDWTGLTLILDFRCILEELLIGHNSEKQLGNVSSDDLTTSLATNFLQVYCGENWGTAIVINAEDGILLTNSHVVNSDDQITLWWKGRMDLASLIYKVPDGEVFDLAILKCNRSFLSASNHQSISFSERVPIVGEEVFSIGFSIFSKEINCKPTICKGCVAKYTDSILMTTCCVNCGMSGGAIVNKIGELLGVIVSNTKLQLNVYPRFNMVIPLMTIRSTIKDFLTTNDPTVLSELRTRHSKHISAWMTFEAKL